MDDQPLDNKEMLDTTDNFEAAYEAHAKSIYRFLFWRTKDVHLSEDLTSSTFEKAWVSRKSFRGGSTQAWFYRIARNVLIDHWRKTKDLPVEDIESLQENGDLTASEILDNKMRLFELRKAVDKLPSDMHEVVRLRFIEGLPSKKVAKKLNLSDNNVRVIQYRALKRLKGYLK
jgi:RNA polymerase sigma-70 factor (ECF subfamily)